MWKHIINPKITAAFLAAAFVGGTAYGVVVYSGPLDTVSFWNGNSDFGRVFVNIINSNQGPDFKFGYDTATNRPYVDARSSIGVTDGLVYILAKSDGGTNGNEGLPATAVGTLIDSNYAGLYPGNSGDNHGMMYENAAATGVVGGWSNSATTDAYVGVILKINGGTNYGWLHFRDEPLANTPNILLVEWAYETTPNKGIVTGNTGSPLIQNPLLNNRGQPSFIGSGIPGYTYGVQSATNLNGQWSNIGTVIAASDGSLSFYDTNQVNHNVFYRLYSPYSTAPQGSRVMIVGFMLGPEWTGRDGSGNSIWDTNYTQGVPCPYDTNSEGGVPSSWWYDTLAQNASLLASNGFTAIWLPPPSKGTFGSRGAYNNVIDEYGGIYDVGYGIFDDYDLGDKPQKGNYQTRYGTREQLNRCVAMMRANGLSVYADIVLNQRNGANIISPVGPAYQWFEYQDAYGDANGGRFPKYYGDFHPGTGPPTADAASFANDPDLPATTYPNGTSTEGSEGFFGADFAPVCGEANINGVPGVWCAQELQYWGDWLINATGIQGYRLDDSGGISWDWERNFITYGAMNGKFIVAELAGSAYDSYKLRDWMQKCMGQTGSNFTMFDQMLEPCLWTMCNTSNFWMGAMLSKYLSWGPGAGTNAMDPTSVSANGGSEDIYRSVMSVDPAQVVSVVNEADSDAEVYASPSAVGPDRCLLGYAYIMTIGFGTPCVDWKDWGTNAGCYGSYAINGQNLQYWINNLVWCHEFVTTGAFGRETNNSTAHVYGFERTGGSKALVFLNSDWTSAESITFTTDIANGTVLQDYTGHTFSPVTVSGGKVTVTVPSDVNGRGYLVLAPSGITGSFSPTQTSVTQQWEANSDLSIPPASSSKAEVCRVWVDNSQTLTASLADYDTTNWTGSTELNLEIDQSSLDNTTNTFVVSGSFSSLMKGQTLVITNTTGAPSFYSFYITGVSLPGSGGPWWFKLRNTYTASQTTPASFNDTGNIYH